MATLKERKAFNRSGSMSTVKASFRTLFPDEAMADQVRSAVDLVQPILMEGSLLANLHILRCFETADSIADLAEVGQTFYNRYVTLERVTSTKRSHKQETFVRCVKLQGGERDRPQTLFAAATR